MLMGIYEAKIKEGIKEETVSFLQADDDDAQGRWTVLLYICLYIYVYIQKFIYAHIYFLQHLSAGDSVGWL